MRGWPRYVVGVPAVFISAILIGLMCYGSSTPRKSHVTPQFPQSGGQPEDIVGQGHRNEENSTSKSEKPTANKPELSPDDIAHTREKARERILRFRQAMKRLAAGDLTNIEREMCANDVALLESWLGPFFIAEYKRELSLGNVDPILLGAIFQCGGTALDGFLQPYLDGAGAMRDEKSLVLMELKRGSRSGGALAEWQVTSELLIKARAGVFSGDNETVLIATYILGYGGGDQSRQALHGILRNYADIDVQIAAMASLARIGDKNSLELADSVNRHLRSTSLSRTQALELSSAWEQLVHRVVAADQAMPKR